MVQQDKYDMLIRQAKAVLDFNWTDDTRCPVRGSSRTSGRGTRLLLPSAIRTTIRDGRSRSSSTCSTASGKTGSCPRSYSTLSTRITFRAPTSGMPRKAPTLPQTARPSGVVQPPIHTTGALSIYRNAEDEAGAKEFLEYAFPRLAAWHEYLYRDRDPETKASCTSATPGRVVWTTPRCGPSSCSGSISGRIRYPNTAASTLIPARLQTVRPAPLTTASHTWSSSSATATTTSPA